MKVSGPGIFLLLLCCILLESFPYCKGISLLHEESDFVQSRGQSPTALPAISGGLGWAQTGQMLRAALPA